MADVLISQLPPFTDFDPNDIVPVTDISTNITRKYTLGNILSGLSSSLSSLANGTQAVTQPTADATTLIATDAFVHNVVNSPLLLANGTQAITQPTADATTLVATDAFVHNVFNNTIKITDVFGSNWVNVTSSRSMGVLYTNTTGKYLMLSITAVHTGALYMVINGVSIRFGINAAGGSSGVDGQITIPPNATYSMTPSGDGVTWAELR